MKRCQCWLCSWLRNSYSKSDFIQRKLCGVQLQTGIDDFLLLVCKLGLNLYYTIDFVFLGMTLCASTWDVLKLSVHGSLGISSNIRTGNIYFINTLCRCFIYFTDVTYYNKIFRLCDYLLACPTVEVRMVFMKIIVFLAHFGIQDPPGKLYIKHNR